MIAVSNVVLGRVMEIPVTGKMTRLKVSVLAALLVVTATACKDDDEVLTPGENTRLEVISDPVGASIELNGVPTGKVTPATIFDIIGRQDVTVRWLSREGVTYGFRTEGTDVRGDSLTRVAGPLVYTCPGTFCPLSTARSRDLGRMRISTQANGSLFVKLGQGEGLLWPVGSSNSYASIGSPLIAMLSPTRDTLALGLYNTSYLAGRPEPLVDEGRSMKQSTWIIPPRNLILANVPTVRGIEIEEELIAAADSDVVFLKLTFRNITNRESYRAVDPVVPASGISFQNVYLGFGIDPDIGFADDDIVTYEPALDMVYAYDSNFFEEIFSTASTARPALVGLRLVAGPTGAVRSLNAWPRTYNTIAGDWYAGTASERNGFSMISGLRSLTPDHPGQQIGYVPSTPQDYRMSVGTGPVDLAPGEAVTITVAIIIAAPVAGEFVSGQVVQPGTPTAADRQIRRIAGTLLQRASGLTAP